MSPLRAEEPAKLRFDELQVAVDALHSENQRLKEDLQQREAVIRVLTENLAIARTESDLFQKRWAEAQARVQTLGVATPAEASDQVRRQLIESMRSLYLADAERQRLVEQLERLLTAVQSGTNVVTEAQHTKQLLAALQQPSSGRETTGRTSPGLDNATVLDVNATLHVVVLNVGSVQDSRVGMPFLVWRGDRVVAELRVVEVRRSICAALMERVERGVTLAAGDVARVAKS